MKNGCVALLDANILYPYHLRDLFMHLSIRGVIYAKWSEQITLEWTLPNASIRNSDLIELIPTLSLPDPDDRHVLAAAISCNADYIVTQNLKDFPSSAVEPFGIEVIGADAFLVRLYSESKGEVLSSVETNIIIA